MPPQGGVVSGEVFEAMGEGKLGHLKTVGEPEPRKQWKPNQKTALVIGTNNACGSDGHFKKHLGNSEYKNH